MKRPKSRSSKGRASLARKTVWALLATVLVAGALLLAYAGTARWLLSGRRLRAWINTTPETSLIDYDEAVSTWPGRIRVKNLRIRGSDPNVEWLVLLGEARIDYSLAALLSRTFRVVGARGTGLRFRLREKLDPPASIESAQSLPPIPGYTDPPLRRAGPEPPAADDGRPWTVDVRNLTVDRFDEIWIDSYRFEGGARLRGAFLLRSGQRAHVGPAAIDFDDGRILLASVPVATEVAGRVQASIGEWDPRRVHGSQVLNELGAGLRLQGHCPGVGFLNHYFPGGDPRFEGGRGTLSVSGTVEEGLGSALVELDVRAARARSNGVDLNGHLRTTLRASNWKLESDTMDLDGSELALSDVVASGGDAARGWWGRFKLPTARLANGLHARVDAQFRDGRPLLAVLGVGLPRWTRGLLDLDGLTATTSVVLAPARTSIQNLDARGGGFHILGEYEARGDRSRGIFLIDTGPLNVGVRTSNGTPSVRLIGAPSWYETEKALFRSPNEIAR